ncbi:protein DENND6A [Selaginella moellendorffii]|uniref:protein DENND6A n=1 Tax=Selaginella moellendorffii TaxID=88036 RepID=UPI000D1CC377|nr:protein DENND6A [Selaginella moellendorffii]|eukprot:XP_024525633.1 protein DENND6A [Selaginella moellendorffii]
MDRSSSFPARKLEHDSGGDAAGAPSLEHWLVGFCTIRFDLEQGQVVEECYPAGALSQEEELDVAFSSFPDSMANSRASKDFGVHDTVFFFRTQRRGLPLENSISRRSSLTRSTSTLPFKADDQEGARLSIDSEVLKKKSNEKSVGVNGTTINGLGKGGQKYLYGFVFNRQRYDAKLKRGGEQKSVLVLSELPLYCVFKPLVELLGPLYFESGVAALEQAALHMSRWPRPRFGTMMELMLGKVVIKSHLPPLHTLPPGPGASRDGFTSAMAPVSPSNRSVPQSIFHDVNLYGVFKGLLGHLWTLWELLLIGEPLLVISPTPSQCCEAVAGLISLIAPLPCSVDFRPYFTIHDPGFASLNSCTEEDRIPPMILGVTNVFFLKALKMFPHVLSVGACGSLDRKKVAGKATSQGRLQKQIQLVRRLYPANLLARKEGPLCLMGEHREALWTTHSPATKGDVQVLNRLVNAEPSLCIEESTSVVNNDALRRHFLELTTNFLAPFGPYLRASTPQEGISPFLGPPPLPPFDALTFLEALAGRGPGKFLSKRSNTHWLNLYRQFLEGPNFMPWFQRRRAVAEQEQHRLWRDACNKADVRVFLRKMTEVEVVDSFNAVERHLAEEIEVSRESGIDFNKTNAFEKITGDLKAIFEFLPKDLQELMYLNPQRAKFLHL